MSAVLLEAVVSDDNGGEFTVKATSRTVLRWEKQFHGRRLDQLQTKFSYVYEVVFIAGTAQLPAGTTFDAFCEGYDIAVQDDEPEPDGVSAVDPTPEAA